MVVLMKRTKCVRAIGLVAIVASCLCSTTSLAGQDVRVVEVTAERFSFTPAEVRVKQGVTIEFRVRSEDTAHGFHILDTDVNGIVPKRGKGVLTIRFQPPQSGKYTFECSKLCGAGHSFMRGTIAVE
jgi:cytochrome c oxidase subunit 2